MTAALSETFPPAGEWTTEDLDAMPDDGRRRELLDGVLIMSPSPTAPHQTLAGQLMAALYETCPDGYDVTQAVEIRFGPRRSFIPDVLVTTATAAKRRTHWYHPHEVVLAVEIVSPTSQAMDRITKPAIYAQAGIPCFWRIELTETVVVHTHQLDPAAEVYAGTGEWTGTLRVTEPWSIELPLSRITPRHL